MYSSYGCEIGNKTEYLAAYEKTPQQFMDNPIIHWEAIWWIERPTALWVIEVVFALISLIEALLVAYLSYKVLSIVVYPLVHANEMNLVTYFSHNFMMLLIKAT